MSTNLTEIAIRRIEDALKQPFKAIASDDNWINEKINLLHQKQQLNDVLREQHRTYQNLVQKLKSDTDSKRVEILRIIEGKAEGELRTAAIQANHEVTAYSKGVLSQLTPIITKLKRQITAFEFGHALGVPPETVERNRHIQRQVEQVHRSVTNEMSAIEAGLRGQSLADIRESFNSAEQLFGTHEERAIRPLENRNCFSFILSVLALSLICIQD